MSDKTFQCPSCKVHPHRQACTLNCEDARVADAHARGRDEAKAEDASIAKSVAQERTASGRAFSAFESGVAIEIADAILAPSSGPTYAERIRAEIAETVAALPATTVGAVGDGQYVNRDDVLAAIDGGGK